MTNNKQQTAVEWLVEKLQESGIPLMTDEFEMIQQAKQMEKEQIENAYEIGSADAWDYARYGDEPTYIGAEQYYIEKYGCKTFIDLVSNEESKVHEVVRKLKEKKK
jgi:hypothetical protein